MIGVVVLPGPSREMHGLDAQRCSSLLPVGDRPMLQHIIESLATQGVTSIELLVGHAPEQVEAVFGNGDRWGCNFRYHLAIEPERPYRSLKVIKGAKTEPWVLVHAEHYPCIEFPSGPIEKPVLYHDTVHDRSRFSNNGHSPRGSAWKGTAVFPAGNWSDVLANQSPDETREHLKQLARSGQATVVSTTEWMDASTPGALLETQTRLLDRRLDGLLISGTERYPGVWISRNVVIHPTAELVAPLYIGPNSRINRGVKLGPNAVISGECIVDTNTTVEHSLVIGGSYIGEGLELNKAVVDRNLLINVPLNTSIAIAESFLLGGLKPVRTQSWFGRVVQSTLAVLLALICLPITLLSIFYFALVRRVSYTSVEMVQLPVQENALASRSYALLCVGKDAWSVQRKASWGTFVRQFLPGLWAVASGRISFVGLPPRTVSEIKNLSEEWRSMYLGSKAGLITEACVATTDPDDETQLYIADAYYAARQSVSYDFKLSCKYFLRLVVPGRQS